MTEATTGFRHRRFATRKLGPTAEYLVRQAEADLERERSRHHVLRVDENTAVENVIAANSWHDSMRGLVKFGDDVVDAIAEGCRLTPRVTVYTASERKRHAELERLAMAAIDRHVEVLRDVRGYVYSAERRADAAATRLRRLQATVRSAKVVATRPQCGVRPMRSPNAGARARRTRVVRTATKATSSTGDPESEGEHSALALTGEALTIGGAS